jgi:fumarate reductase flavoprotein subunit
MIVEAEEFIGGATRQSAGMINAAGTDVQRKLGIEDDPAAFYREYQVINRYEPQPGLVARLAFDGAGTLSWLTELGVEFDDVADHSVQLVPRSHQPSCGKGGAGGQYLVDLLSGRCRERGVEIAVGRRVDRLLHDGSEVTGVGIGDDELSAGAVVVATGGFSANPELIAKYLPTLDRAGDRVFYVGPESSRGDVFAFAEQVGASITGFDRCVTNLHPDIGPGPRAYDPHTPAWLLMVGPEGTRLFDETAPYGMIIDRVHAVGGRVFGLFDARTRADSGTPELQTPKADYGGSPIIARLWNREGIDRMVAGGGIVEADTLEQLAAELRVPVRAMLASIARYNESAFLGEDRDFRKDPKFLRPIEQPPFYAAELRPAILGLTSCGPQIDKDASVLDEDLQEIPGLFAAGECTGGVIGPVYSDGGNSLANCVVFGRTAGRSAAAFALA